MQAVILAGGLGTRLKPLTEQIPKTMTPVNGKPFLLHLLELLIYHGINDIVLCTGYLSEQILKFFGSGENLGLRIRYSEEKEKLLGTGGALKQA
jgi:NDP-sugar pyrophosphorylase family protein